MITPLNFTRGKVTDLGNPFQDLLNQKAAEQKSAQEAVRFKEKLALQKADMGMRAKNAENMYNLNVDENARKAQQDEYNMQMKAAEMGLKSDKDVQDALFQSKRLDILGDQAKSTKQYQNSMLNEKIDQRKAVEGRQAGIDIGSMMSIPESEMKDGTKLIYDANAKQMAQDEFSNLTKNVGISEQEKQKAYEDYLQKNDPEAYAKYTTTRNLYDRTVGPDTLFGKVMSPIDAIKNNITDPLLKYATTPDKSQAERDQLATEPITTKEGVMSRDAFFKDLDGSTTQAKNAIKEFIMTDTDYQKSLGIAKDTATSTAVRRSEDDMRASALEVIKDYAAKNNVGTDDPKVRGMLSAANDKITKVLDNRTKADALAVKYEYDKLDKDAQREFERDLVKLKDQLGRVATPAEEAKMKLDLINAKLKEQEYENNKGWFFD